LIPINDESLHSVGEKPPQFAMANLEIPLFDDKSNEKPYFERGKNKI